MPVIPRHSLHIPSNSKLQYLRPILYINMVRQVIVSIERKNKSEVGSKAPWKRALTIDVFDLLIV